MTLAGVYRGIVVNNVDPMSRGRLQIKVPAVSGDGALDWALPMVDPGETHVLPAMGDGVWVMFEHGRVERPVWTGVWKW